MSVLSSFQCSLTQLKVSECHRGFQNAGLICRNNHPQFEPNTLINAVLLCLVNSSCDRDMTHVVVHGLLHPVGVTGDFTYLQHSHHRETVTIALWAFLFCLCSHVISSQFSRCGFILSSKFSFWFDTKVPVLSDFVMNTSTLFNSFS